jgi:cytochrome c peroxidase
MDHSLLRLKSPVGRRAPGVFFRIMVILLCCAMVSPGIFMPGLSMASPADQFMSLKEVPVPEPRAAVIPVVTPGVNPIPGPETPLNFQPLLAEIVKDQPALVQLGKALFWDMQVGSDGVQACATCHFNAGADIRSKNQVSPGVNDTNFRNARRNPIGGDNRFGNSTVPYTAHDPNTPNPPGPSEPPPAQLNVPGNPLFRPNYDLTAADFPLNDWFVATQLVPRGPGVGLFDELAGVSRDTNDVVSSQGVRHTQFSGVIPGSAVDDGIPLPDVFNTKTPGKLNLTRRTRRVEPRNAPTMINAVYNFDNFWEGRASFIFNGVNPFGFRDREHTLKENIGGVLTDVFIRVTNSSLASQAVGPPQSNFEMSFEGRSFQEIGKKMVSLRPLAQQLVHPEDSVLGPLSRATLTNGAVTGLPGLNVNTYRDMVQAAFQDQWWNSGSIIAVAPGTNVVQQPSANDPRTMVLGPGKTSVSERTTLNAPLAANQYSQIEFNFSLFFGLAVQAYEATLISDDTPFDRFMGAPSLGIAADPNALNDQQRLGLSIFLDSNANFGSHCADCHVPPITTGHTVLDFQPDDQGVPSLALGEAIEFMIMADNLETANYDHGMYNIGVRRTTEDLGRANTAPAAMINPMTGKPFPLSLVNLAALRHLNRLPPDVARFIPKTKVLPRRVTRGAFKVPNLRNLKFTGPYLHNGDSATLRQVVEFYTRGGNFPNTNLHDKTVNIDGIPLLMFPDFLPPAQENVQALVAFLAEGLKDRRVAYEQAPFDHPQLSVPDGSPVNHPEADILTQIPPVGQSGRPTEISTFLSLDPQQP